MKRALTLTTMALASFALGRSVAADQGGAADSMGGTLLPRDRETGPLVDQPPQRRGGVVLGLSYGVGLGASAGYPNDSSLIGDSNYYSASGLMTGAGGGLFVMGALSDYLNFGFWFGSATFANKDWHSTGEGGGFRVEGFPLFSLGRGFRDLAVFTQLGIGGTDLVYKGKPGVSSDGVESFFGAGLFYEFWLCRALGGHLALGPSLEYDAIVTEPIERHGALLGVRFAWYGGR